MLRPQLFNNTLRSVTEKVRTCHAACLAIALSFAPNLGITKGDSCEILKSSIRQIRAHGITPGDAMHNDGRCDF